MNISNDLIIDRQLKVIIDKPITTIGKPNKFPNEYYINKKEAIPMKHDILLGGRDI